MIPPENKEAYIQPIPDIREDRPVAAEPCFCNKRKFIVTRRGSSAEIRQTLYISSEGRLVRLCMKKNAKLYRSECMRGQLLLMYIF